MGDEGHAWYGRAPRQGHRRRCALPVASPENAIVMRVDEKSQIRLVEVWLGSIERQAIHRGAFSSVLTPTPRSARSSTAGTTAPDLRLDQDRRRDPQEANCHTNSSTGQLAVA